MAELGHYRFYILWIMFINLSKHSWTALFESDSYFPSQVLMKKTFQRDGIYLWYVD